MNLEFILVLIALGYTIKRIHIVKKEIADSLIKLVFHIFLPATLFYSLVSLPLNSDLLILPLCGFLVALFSYLFGFLIMNSTMKNMEKRTRGSFLIACGAMNQGMFIYPFFLMYFGTEGLAYAAFYDIGQAFMAFTLGYYIAVRFSNTPVEFNQMANKMLKFPVLWAFFCALLINYLELSSLIRPVFPLIEMLHNCTVPLIMISLGIFMEPKIIKGRAMIGVIFTRFVVALLFAFLLVFVFKLEGLVRITVLIASAAPPAMITLVYSVEEKLDVEFATALLSITIAWGLVYIPLLFALLT